MHRRIDGTKRYETLHPYETSQIVRKGARGQRVDIYPELDCGPKRTSLPQSCDYACDSSLFFPISTTRAPLLRSLPSFRPRGTRVSLDHSYALLFSQFTLGILLSPAPGSALTSDLVSSVLLFGTRPAGRSALEQERTEQRSSPATIRHWYNCADSGRLQLAHRQPSPCLSRT